MNERHPKCGSVAMVVTIPAHLSHTGRERTETKPIDACIAPAVAALNAAGVETWGSCCGHSRSPATILTASGEVTFEPPFHITHLGRVHDSPADPERGLQYRRESVPGFGEVNIYTGDDDER